MGRSCSRRQTKVSILSVLLLQLISNYRYLRERENSKETTVAPKRRAKKDPNAPRRPMSAFLAFSQARRSEVKNKNPTLKNTDVSRLLGSIWRTAPLSEKTRFREAEKLEREKYNEKMRIFRLQKSTVHTPDKQLEQEPQPIVTSPSSAFEHYRGNRQVFRSYSGRHPFDNRSSQSQRKQYTLHHGNDQAVFASHKVNTETPLFAPKQYPSIVTAPPSFGSPQQSETIEIQRAGSDLTRFDALYAGVFGSFTEDDKWPPLLNKAEQQLSNGSHYFADVFQQP